ncbi:sugar porter family MFS transporter [Thermostilla marina]
MNTTSENHSFNYGYLWLICLVAAMGGLLFGYDWVVIGGAKPFYEPFLHIGDDTPWLRGFAQSSALVGCLVGALTSGALADKTGRRPLLILAGLLFTVSAVWTALSTDYVTFNIARIIGGVGIGLASNMSPMYIAEISPAKIRGVFVSINQLTIVIGILAAQLVNLWIAQPVTEETAEAIRASWNGMYGWRWMFGAETVPAAAFFVLMLFVPESPRWLVKAGRDDKARGILDRIGGEAYAAATLDEIRTTLSQEEIGRVRWSDLLEPKIAGILVFGSFLAVAQQWCGINVIFNYAQEVFTNAGFSIDATLLSIVLTGVTNLVFTIPALFLVDRLGRRPLMLAGFGALASIYVLMGLGYFQGWTGVPMLVLVMIAIGTYATTLAPVTWVVLSEIFPNRIRGAAMSIAVFFLWIGCTTLTLTFPSLLRSLDAHGTFWLYAAFCATTFFVLWRKLPETKGKSLEQIEHELVD